MEVTEKPARCCHEINGLDWVDHVGYGDSHFYLCLDGYATLRWKVWQVRRRTWLTVVAAKLHLTLTQDRSRTDFDSFWASVISVFRILIGEWTVPLYDAIRATNAGAIVYFVAVCSLACALSSLNPWLGSARGKLPDLEFVSGCSLEQL